MPKLSQSYQIANETVESIHQKNLTVLQEMKAEEIREESTVSGGRKVTAMVPSIWGWGGMKLGTVTEVQGNIVILVVEGYIAQLATSPLKKVMEEFIAKLTVQLGPDKIRAAESNNTSGQLVEAIDSKGLDSKMVIMVLLLLLIPALGGVIFGREAESFFGGTVLALGYYFGRKLFYKS